MQKNKTCCFFGHREVTHNIRGKLIEIIDNLITEKDVKEFYVGHQGQFDNMAYSVLKELKSNYLKLPTPKHPKKGITKPKRDNQLCCITRKSQ